MMEQNAKENALREGRIVSVAEYSNNFCKCSNAFKFAKYETFDIGGKIYMDTKCYKCNQEWSGRRYNHVTDGSSGRVILD